MTCRPVLRLGADTRQLDCTAQGSKPASQPQTQSLQVRLLERPQHIEGMRGLGCKPGILLGRKIPAGNVSCVYALNGMLYVDANPARRRDAAGQPITAVRQTDFRAIDANQLPAVQPLEPIRSGRLTTPTLQRATQHCSTGEVLFFASGAFALARALHLILSKDGFGRAGKIFDSGDKELGNRTFGNRHEPFRRLRPATEDQRSIDAAEGEIVIHYVIRLDGSAARLNIVKLRASLIDIVEI